MLKEFEEYRIYVSLQAGTNILDITSTETYIAIVKNTCLQYSKYKIYYFTGENR